MEPVAIIGFSFRFPQGAEDEGTFWSLLREGKNVMTEWPESRATIGALLNHGSAVQNTLSSRGGHFLQEDPAAFDAPFFSTTTKEAAAMDPQQRWILEASYRAMENAGIPIEQAAGTDTAVFAATMADDYAKLIYKDPDEAPKTFAINTHPAMLANRISWYFDFTGPSIQLNTACSGSMIAVDLACTSLRQGQSSMALVAGTNTLLTPEESLYLENMNFLSKDSQCYTFDHRANGYARGEGVAVLVLKRLSDAVRNGDVIRAVIRGSGSNQDGHTPGITQPNPKSQEALIRAVYGSCKLDFTRTRYVEAHGTGTQLGDVTETKALGRIFRTARSPQEPLYIGSVKSNIGHLEGASALASILKSIMILEKGVIPPNALFEKLNPKINANFNNLQVPTSCIPWPTAGIRRISINCFGFGGSNGHLILDDTFHTLEALDISTLTHIPASFSLLVATRNEKTDGTASDRKNRQPSRSHVNIEDLGAVCSAGNSGQVRCLPHCNDSEIERENIPVNHLLEDSNSDTSKSFEKGPAPYIAESAHGFRLLIWSAKDEAALKRMLQAYSEYCDKNTSPRESFIESLAYTLSVRRSLMSWRAFGIVSEQPSFDIKNLSLLKPVRSSSNPGGLTFVFTGQGAQYAKMGLELRIYPVFDAVLSRCMNVIRELGADWSFFEMLGDPDKIHDPQMSQPLCTSLQIALVELLREFGVVPDAVVGHSSGEIAAAYTVGALSLECAVKIAYHRGRLAQRLLTMTSKRGAMISVNIPESDIDAYLDKASLGASISVACINSPLNITLSGDSAAIDKIQKHLDEDKISAWKLRTGVAYHSPAMQQIAEEYGSCIGSPESRVLSDDNILMVSSVTGLKISSISMSQGQYWVENLVSTVRFADALQYLAMAAPKLDGVKTLTTYIEIGPHAALKRPISDTLGEARKGQSFSYFPLLSRLDSPIKSTLDVVGRLFVLGHPVSVTDANRQTNNAREWPFLVDTPAYPYDHSQLHWHETRLSRHWRLREAASRTVLGVRVSDWNPLEPRWRKMLRIAEMPWLDDHVIGENTLFPAAGMINMALEAVRQTAHTSQTIAGYRIKEASFQKPIVIRPQSDNEVITQLCPLQETHETAVLRFEVKLFTVVDSLWSECSRFTIHLEYKEDANEVDGDRETRVAAETMVREYSHALETSTKQIRSQDFYRWGRDHGLKWSGTFSLADDIRWDGDKVATALVHGEPHDGLFHPGVLDSAFQMGYVPPSHGASKKLPTVIPSKFIDIWISATGWQYPHPRLIRTLARSQIMSNGQGIECSIKMLSEDQLPLCHISKAVMLPVMDHRQSHDGTKKLLLHRIDWKPTLSLFKVDQLRRYCGTDRPVVDEHSAVNFARKLDKTLRLIFQHNSGRLLKTNWATAPPQMKNYVSFMERQLHDMSENIVETTDEEILKGELEELIATRPSARVFVQVAQNLVSVVCGERDVSELIQSTSLVQDFYEDLLGLFLDHRFTSYIQLSVHQTPGLRILEVGAGLGAMTNLVLTILERIEAMTGGTAFSHYLYTDACDSNLDKARQRFRKHQNRMIFEVFDLEKDIPSHMIQSENFDMILAGGALHTTTNLSGVLQSLHSLLKPGGHLIFCEATAPHCFSLSFGFGVLPAWWSRKREYLMCRQMVTEAEWDIVLRENGFSGADLIIRDYEDDVAHCASIIVSSSSHMPQEANEAARILLIVREGDEQQKSLAQVLSDRMSAPLRCQVLIVPFDDSQDTQVRFTDYVVFLADLRGSLLADISEPTLNLIKRLIQRLGNLLWVTCTSEGNEATTGIKDGFLRTLRAEFNAKRIVGLSLEDADMDGYECASHISDVFMSAFVNNSSEVEFVVRGTRILTGRLVGDVGLDNKLSSLIYPETHASPWLPGPPLKLHMGRRGHLDTLHFREDMEYYKDLGPTEVEIEAKAWAVNFRDVFGALGRLDEPGFGLDCAGIVSRIGPQCKLVRPGDRVCMCLWDCMRMFPRGDEQDVVKIPPSVSFEEACAVIAPGMTSWHALAELARLSHGEKVLIHAASGATGQLAVQIAKNLGAEVFATVGNGDKKQLLIEDYGIPEDHIFNSRSNNTTFAQGIRRMTDGYGVDVVLNSLKGEGLRASWDCIAPYGRFIEIGKADINANASLPMGNFANNAMFAAVDIRHMIVQRKQRASELFNKVMAMANEGDIHCPRPLHVYSVNAIEDAFRYIQSGKNTGRVIIRIEASTSIQKCLITRTSWRFCKDASYLVVGGLGGIGRSILVWMAARGAKNLIIPLRSSLISTAGAKVVSELRERNITIMTPRCDVASWESLSGRLQDWSKSMPIIRGCINAAMVLQDSTFENMSHTQWNLAIRSKVATSQNLHRLFTDLDFMVFLSSVSGIVGNPGQSNYAAGCTFQDSLAQYRTRNGQQTVSIDLGALRTVGVVAESKDLQRHLRSGAQGLGQIEETELLALLDICCDPATNALTSHSSQIVMGLRTPSDLRTRGLAPPETMQRPLFTYFSQVPLSSNDKTGTDSEDVNFSMLFQRAETIDERSNIVGLFLTNRLARALHIDSEDINLEKPLHSYGVDSLVAVELRNWIATDFAADVPVFELVGRTVQGVSKFVEKFSRIKRKEKSSISS